MNNELKLGGGMIHAGYLSGSKTVNRRPYKTPNCFDVKFLFWAPWHVGSHEVIGGRNIGLSYIVLFQEDKPFIERIIWQNESDESIPEEIKDLYVDKLKQYALDLALECRQRKFFEYVICTQEQLQKVGWNGEENFGDKPRLRREWFDFNITPDFKVCEVNSLFRFFLVEDDKEYDVFPTKDDPNLFIRSPHIVRFRRKNSKYPSTDYKKVHDLFANYGFDKPVTLNSQLPEFFRDKDKITAESKENAFMNYEEFIKALKEDKDGFSDVSPLRKYKQPILDSYDGIV